MSGHGLKTYPASLNQEQFWLIDKLQPGNPAYNIPSLFYIDGPLNVKALTGGIQEIITRHDIFRTTFFNDGERLFQIVSEDAHSFFQAITVDTFRHPYPDGEIHQKIQDEIKRPFDLETGPLLRAKLFCLGSRKYIFLIVMHHSITDLRSKELFASELSGLYRAFALNDTSPPPLPAYQYKAYASWQNDWLRNQDCQSMIDYWKETLNGYSGYLNLPTDRPRPPVLKLSGDAVRFHLPEAFTRSLKTVISRRDTPLFPVLLTAYYILLYRYTGQQDIVAGVPLTNRRREQHKTIAGCFVNILPIAVSVSSRDTFSTLLHQVRLAMLGAHRNQEVPYNRIIRELALKRDVSFNPVFQTGFTFEPPMELELCDVSVRSAKVHNQGAQLDLFFTLWEQDSEVHGFIEFNRELFDKATIQRLSGNYKTLLNEIITGAEHGINSLNILTDREKHQQLVLWNRTEVPVPEEPLVHRLFEIQERITPDSTAFACDGLELTYQQLNTRANRLAHYLQTLGVGTGDLVGIYMDRSLDMVVALYAILKSGAAYVPLDPAFPGDRIAYMIDDTRLRIVLTQTQIVSQLAGNNAIKVLVDTIWPEINALPGSSPESDLSPENLAYVIYTSGSTGKPKGVQVPHRAAVNFLLSMKREPGITEQDTLLAVTTLSFDISVLELFLPQTTGAKTVIASQETASNGEQLLSLINQSKTTVMQATPTTWYLLIAAGWEGSEGFKVLCGGEPMPQDLAQKLSRRSAHVWNMYGPTETTVWSTCCQVREADSPVLVGKPIDNTQIYILNQDNQPNPVGVAGEMLIGGTGVTHGYLNRPGLTREKFIPDIFNPSSGYPLYRTGDMACYLPDGSISVLGRIDNQIKLRGFRIELGEIEAVLESHSAIRQATTIVREDDPDDKRLVAYAVLHDGYVFSEIELRKYLRTKLPEYMVPSVFVQMDTMPLTLNGKIDRRALPMPERKRDTFGQDFVPPESGTERKLSEIWSRILKIDKVGTQDNFFDLGGNSLLSVQLVALLENTAGISIPIVTFYQYPTINALSGYLNSNGAARKDNGLEETLNRAHLQRDSLALRRQLQMRR